MCTKKGFLVFAVCLSTLLLFSCRTAPKTPSSKKTDAEQSGEAASQGAKPDPQKKILQVSVKPEEKITNRYRYSVEVPSFADYPELNKRIQSCLKSRFAEFDKLSAENYQARVKTLSPAEYTAFEKTPSNIIPQHSFIVTWEAGELSPNIISIKLETYEYTGGANGMILIDTFTWLPKENRLQTISDVPAWAKLPYSNKAWLSHLSQQSRFLLENKLNREKDPTLSDMIKNGTQAETKNFSAFTLDGRILTLWFEKYQVAPGSYGTVFINMQL